MTDIFEVTPEPRIEALETEVKLSRLRGRVRNVEVMGFQDQLNAVDKTIDNMRIAFLAMRQKIATVELDLSILWMIRYLIDQTVNLALKDAADTCNMALRQLVAGYKASANTSLTPEDLVAEWNTQSREVMPRYGFEGFYPV